MIVVVLWNWPFRESHGQLGNCFFSYKERNFFMYMDSVCVYILSAQSLRGILFQVISLLMKRFHNIPSFLQLIIMLY